MEFSLLHNHERQGSRTSPHPWCTPCIAIARPDSQWRCRATPYTIHPTLYTLNSAPHTLHPTTLHPTPYTLHHTPYAQGPGRRWTTEEHVRGSFEKNVHGHICTYMSICTYVELIHIC